VKFMNKLFLGLFLLAGQVVWGQGIIVFNNVAAQYLIYTNQDGVTGPTSLTPNSYYYALLLAPYGGATPTQNPFDSAWRFSGVMATNTSSFAAGGIRGPGGAAGVAVAGWGAPVGPTYDTGTEMYFMIVGWSSNLGANWNEFSSALGVGLLDSGFYGLSPVGYGYSGGGPYVLPPPSLFGATPAMPAGLQAGFFLNGFTISAVSAGFAVPIPEPGTLVLAGLGGLSLLAFRRKK